MHAPDTVDAPHPPPAEQPRGWFRPLLVFLLVALVGISVSHFTPVGQFLNTDTMREVAEHLGWKGPFLIFLVALFAPLLFLPRWPIAMVCGMLYGVVAGSLLANFCSACGAWLQFGVALRTLSPVAEQWNHSPWMARLSRHQDRAFAIVFCLRAFPFSSSVATNLVAGALNVRTRVFLSATFLGMLPSSFMYAAGGKLLKQPSPGFYVLAVAIVFLFMAAAWLSRRRLTLWLAQDEKDQACQPRKIRQGMEPPKTDI